MAARVDTRAMLVRDGALAIAFAADCGAGTAVLDPEGEPHAVRLLRWREKCALARFVDAGPEFLEAQFVTISGGALPGDPARREALSALAFWLHGAAPLPLDTDLLGDVTLDLCAALAIGPAELGALAAPEVEALWQACDMRRDAEPDSAGRVPDAMRVPSGMTRIVIEPDPASHPSEGHAIEAAGAPDIVVPAIADAAMQAPDAPGSSTPPLSSDSRPRPQPAADGASRDAASAERISGAVSREPALVHRELPERARSAPEAAARAPEGDPAIGRAGAIPATVSAERPASAADQMRGARRAAPRFRFRFRTEGQGEAAATMPPGAVGESPAAPRGSTSAGETGLAGIDAPRAPHPSAATPRAESAPGSPIPPGSGAAERQGARADRPLRRRPRLVDGSSATGRGPEAHAAQRLPGSPAEPRPEPVDPAAAAIAAMVSRISGTGAAGGTARAASLRPATPLRAAPPLAAATPPGAPAIDARLGALVDIVTRAAAPRPDAAADPDAMIDSFGDRLADAVAELGLAGAD